MDSEFGIDIAVFIPDRYEETITFGKVAKKSRIFAKKDMTTMYKVNKKELEYNLNLRRVIW
jgi:hypothetical protein